MQHFPNLNKLTLAIDSVWPNEPRRILLKVLPYVRGIKFLNLMIHVYEPHSESSKMLKNIFKLPELEELKIFLDDIQMKSTKTFINKLVLSCTNLRGVELGN